MTMIEDCKENRHLGVSVIIPAKNEEKYIERCIDSILNQDYEGSFEIIVIDNCSTDKTYDLAKTKKVSVFKFDGNSPSAVRNYGATLSKFEILAFIDGDCEAPKHWLSVAIDNLKDRSVAMTGGGCFAPEGSSLVTRSWAPVSTVEKKNTIAKNVLLPGSNMLIKKQVFIDVSGFDESLISAEDDDLCKRTIRSGMSILKDDSLSIVHHGYPSTLYEVFKKSLWHGSTQLKAHGLFGDKMVMLTLVWAASLLFLLMSIFFAQNSTFVLLLIVLFLPFVLSMVRIKNISYCDRLGLLIISYIVCFLVVFGRSVGMIREMVVSSNISGLIEKRKG